MLFMIITILAAIPVTAIISSTWLKSKELDVKSGFSAEEKEVIRNLLIENQELRERVENLEVMIADIDLDTLKSDSAKQILK